MIYVPHFAQNVPNQLIDGFGLPAAIVIFALVAVIIYLARDNKALHTRIDAIQEQRIVAAQEYGDKIAEPLNSIKSMSEKQTEITGKMYEILLDSQRRK